VTWRALSSAVLALFLVGGHEGAPAPFARGLLAVEADCGPPRPLDDARTLSELARIAALVRARANAGASRADALNGAVFGQLGFVREVDDTDLRFVFLSSVLAGKRGSCVGLGTLYIALGELLGWKIEGVMVPGHFYVRVDEGGSSRNVELLRKGERMPDAWYRTRFPVPGRGAPEYGRALSTKEVLGVVEYDVGNERRRQGLLPAARRAYRSSAASFPGFAEAHASLGATEHLLGALDAALISYGAARQANPDLPGVGRNLALLRAELDDSTRR
jgi:hypothetical protein